MSKLKIPSHNFWLFPIYVSCTCTDKSLVPFFLAAGWYFLPWSSPQLIKEIQFLQHVFKGHMLRVTDLYNELTSSFTHETRGPQAGSDVPDSPVLGRHEYNLSQTADHNAPNGHNLPRS